METRNAKASSARAAFFLWLIVQTDREALVREWMLVPTGAWVLIPLAGRRYLTPHPAEGDGNATDGSDDEDGGGQPRHRRQSACAWPSSAYSHVVLTTAACDGGLCSILFGQQRKLKHGERNGLPVIIKSCLQDLFLSDSILSSLTMRSLGRRAYHPCKTRITV